MPLSLIKDFSYSLPGYINLQRKAPWNPFATSLALEIWQKLRPRDEKYRQIVENAVVGIFQATTSGHFLTANPMLAKIYGYDFTRELTDTAAHLKAKLYTDPNRYKELMRLLRERQKVTNFESQVYRKDGSIIWISENVRLVCDPKGLPVGCEGTVEDITERKIAEIALAVALEKATKTSQLNSQFASMVSHELRNSLTVISASTDLLRLHSQKMTPQERLGRFEKIRTAIKHMSELIEGVLTIGKVEAGKLTFEQVRLDLKVFLQEIWQDIQTMTKGNHILEIACPTCTSITLETDPRILRQIFINLILNAVKYSPNVDKVECEFICERGEAVFRIKDWGIGIPLEDRDRLFQEFHRGQNTGNFEGNGLGLAIVKKAVHLHGGSIAVESQLGVGTTFTVRLPKVCA